MLRDSWAVRLCVMLLRVFARLVPRDDREAWFAEWEAEVRHRAGVMRRHPAGGVRAELNLVRRALGALPDAAWLLRQFTGDAEFVHDTRHAVRMLRKSAWFTVSAVLVLGLGIAGTVSMASILDALLFRPLPYADAEQIVTVWQERRNRGGSDTIEDVAPANFLEWRSRSASFASMAAAIPYSFDYTGGGDPEVFFGAQVTEGFWDAIGTHPALGRGFLPEEHARGGRRVAMLSHGLWQRRFGGDPAILGRAISLDGEPWTVVGVLPVGFAPQILPRPGDLGVWTPKVIQEHEPRIRDSAWWNVVARLRPGVTVEQAQAELDAISRALAREFPRSNEHLTARLVPLREHLMGGLRLPLLLMLAAVGVVLAIGCANVASLLLARGLERHREFAIRTALGAGRGRLVRQLVTESLLLSGLSAVVGVIVARWGIRAIVALAPGGVLRLQDARIDERMLLFTAAIATATAIAFGLVPALQFSRPGRGALNERTTGAPRAIIRRGLVAGEVALALLLLTGAGLLLRSFTHLTAVDPGFKPDGVVALQVFAWDRHSSPEKTRVFFSSALERIRAIPGVERAGAVSAMPFMIANIDLKSPIDVLGRVPRSADERAGAYLTIVMPGYFEAMSVPLRQGRLLASSDHARATRVAVVSEALSRREWPDGNVIGQRIRMQFQGDPIEAEVVGVVSQIRHDGLDGVPRPEVFVPLEQVPFASMTFVVRGTRSAEELISSAKAAVWSVDPLQTFYDVASVEALVDVSVADQRFSVTVLSVFAACALLLCAIGVYGLMSFTTLQRTREIGVRMALGADAATIRRMVLRDGSAIVGAGIAAGLLVTFASTRVLRSLLFDVHPSDPLTFAAVSLVLTVVGVTACYLPARRATRVDPLVALRSD